MSIELTPKNISIRELKVRHKILATTLTDDVLHSKNERDELYISRWNIEVYFRNSKEMWIYLLANNLIRILMAQTAKKFSISIRSISFKNTLQIWN